MGVINTEGGITLGETNSALPRQGISSTQSSLDSSSIAVIHAELPEQESVQVALQDQNSMVLTLGTGEGTEDVARVIRIDDNGGESRNCEVKASLQSILQLLQLQQGNIQIEIPQGMSADQSVLLSDIIQVKLVYR